MANIVTDPDAKRTALIHLLELKPDNAKARAMLEDLEVESVFSLGDLAPANQTNHPFVQKPKIRIRTADILLVGGALILVVILLLGAGWYAYTYQHSGLLGLFGQIYPIKPPPTNIPCTILKLGKGELSISQPKIKM